MTFQWHGKNKAETIRDHAVGDDIVIRYSQGWRTVLLSHEPHVAERNWGNGGRTAVRKVRKGERTGRYDRTALTWRNRNVGFPIAVQQKDGDWICSITKEVCGTPREERAFKRAQRVRAIEVKAADSVNEARRIADVDYVRQVAEEIGLSVWIEGDYERGNTRLGISAVASLLRSQRLDG